MKLFFNNLGAIKNNTTSIDLEKRFYVFVGANNSGKTYVSHLLWTIFNKEVINKFAEIFKIKKEKSKNFQKTFTQKLLNEIVEDYAKFLKKEIAFTFNTDNNNKLKEIIFDKLEIKFEIQPADYEQFGFEKLIEGEKLEFIKNILFKLLQVEQDAFFLPATRSFLSVFYYHILQYEVKRLKIDRKGKYSKTIENLIDKTIELKDDSSLVQIQLYNNLLARVESIMSGSLELVSTEGMGLTDFELKIKKMGKNIPAYLSSSSVNQLTYLSIFFKYWAKEKRNFLMIDEPEENLHPQNQIELLKVLISFATQNENRVLITTHSPLLAEAINNYLYLNTLREKYGYDDDLLKEVIKENNLHHLDISVSISKQQLGVYFFDGEKIIDYEDDNEGVFFRDFRKFSNNIVQNNDILFRLIHQNKEENE